MVKGKNVPDWLLAKPIAHRGLHAQGGAPENSLEAFHAAIRAGLPIELDVHLLADQQPVVFHDNDLMRLTGVEGKIEEQDAQSIRPLRLLQTDQAVPLFAEVLREVDGAAPLLIEIKSAASGVGALEQAVLRALQDYQGPFAIQSFNPMSVHYFKIHAPAICRGQLSGGNHGVPYAKLNLPNFVAYHVDALTPRRTARLRGLGVPLLAWTISNTTRYTQAKRFADNYIFDTTPDFTLPSQAA
jgi:glycerophosphoryl diester phosphodiesterase